MIDSEREEEVEEEVREISLAFNVESVFKHAKIAVQRYNMREKERDRERETGREREREKRAWQGLHKK